MTSTIIMQIVAGSFFTFLSGSLLYKMKRIDDQLDQKADTKTVDKLEERVIYIERYGCNNHGLKRGSENK